MTLTIRDATADDAPDVSLIQIEGWRTTYRGLISDAYLDGLDVTQRTEYWKRPLTARTPGWHLVVAEIGREAVGFGCAGPAGSEALDGYDAGITALYVRPAHRNKKVGEALLGALFERLRRDGRKNVSLWVLQGNDRAEAFYRRMGADEILRAERPGAGGSLREIAMGWKESAVVALLERRAA